ncbi:MAG: hypothetical protein GX267_08615 [Fibrobacter sp.]|jgi:hypothetical protein|nr:hypothetical protein [Fibrobacter sp.]
MLITFSLILSLLFCLFSSCIDTSLPEKTPVVRIEQWRLTEPGTENNVDITINTHQDGLITCEGRWQYFYTGIEVTSNDLSGSVYKDTTYISISCTGTAHLPEDYSESLSLYNLTFKGQIMNGSYSGIWEISFKEPQWDKKAPRRGKFSGILTYEKIMSQ